MATNYDFLKQQNIASSPSEGIAPQMISSSPNEGITPPISPSPQMIASSPISSLNNPSSVFNFGAGGTSGAVTGGSNTAYTGSGGINPTNINIPQSSPISSLSAPQTIASSPNMTLPNSGASMISNNSAPNLASPISGTTNVAPPTNPTPSTMNVQPSNVMNPAMQSGMNVPSVNSLGTRNKLSTFGALS
jgi:hypothetical protein